MNFAIILSGGISERVGADIPKQYLRFHGKPLLFYTLEQVKANAMVDQVIIVASEEWQPQIRQWCDDFSFTKPVAFASPGSSRQASTLQGLKKCLEFSGSVSDKVIIHEAVRPFASSEMITSCFEALEDADLSIPVVPQKEAIYKSEDGLTITSLLERKTLYVGQAPEGAYLHRYFEIHQGLTESELASICGGSELAFAKGLKVRLFAGNEKNFKITTPEDIERFSLMIEQQLQETETYEQQ